MFLWDWGDYVRIYWNAFYIKEEIIMNKSNIFYFSLYVFFKKSSREVYPK